MATGAAKGKALLAKLKGTPGVRDPEALAAWIGRKNKKLKGVPSLKGSSGSEKGRKLAGSGKPGAKKSGGALAERIRGSTSPKTTKRDSVLAPKPDLSDDDPFNEDFGPNEEKTKEQRQQQRIEAKLIADLEKADRAKLYQAFTETGGLKTRDDLREEYRNIPNIYKRKDGLPGDEMADYLGRYYPELGIETENDLIEYFMAA